MKGILTYFTKWEWTLWLGSMVLIVLSNLLFGQWDSLSVFGSLVGVTSLIFCARGNPFGQVLMILFSLFYGYISYTFAYYGEMITYLGMSGPMAAVALVSWLRHPFRGKRSQVAVHRVRGKEWAVMILLSLAVTVAFYFVLACFHTANLLPSTLSITTSFLAVLLTAQRSPYYALVYAANDVVLIVLWVLALQENPGYLSVVICFIVFLFNDLYGFYNWRKMEKMQKDGER